MGKHYCKTCFNLIHACDCIHNIGDAEANDEGESSGSSDSSSDSDEEEKANMVIEMLAEDLAHTIATWTNPTIENIMDYGDDYNPYKIPRLNPQELFPDSSRDNIRKINDMELQFPDTSNKKPKLNPDELFSDKATFTLDAEYDKTQVSMLPDDHPNAMVVNNQIDKYNELISSIEPLELDMVSDNTKPSIDALFDLNGVPVWSRPNKYTLMMHQSDFPIPKPDENYDDWYNKVFTPWFDSSPEFIKGLMNTICVVNDPQYGPDYNESNSPGGRTEYKFTAVNGEYYSTGTKRPSWDMFFNPDDYFDDTFKLSLYDERAGGLPKEAFVPDDDDSYDQLMNNTTVTVPPPPPPPPDPLVTTRRDYKLCFWEKFVTNANVPKLNTPKLVLNGSLLGNNTFLETNVAEFSLEVPVGPGRLVDLEIPFFKSDVSQTLDIIITMTITGDTSAIFTSVPQTVGTAASRTMNIPTATYPIGSNIIPISFNIPATSTAYTIEFSSVITYWDSLVKLRFNNAPTVGWVPTPVYDAGLALYCFRPSLINWETTYSGTETVTTNLPFMGFLLQGETYLDDAGVFTNISGTTVGNQSKRGVYGGTKNGLDYNFTFRCRDANNTPFSCAGVINYVKTI